MLTRRREAIVTAHRPREGACRTGVTGWRAAPKRVKAYIVDRAAGSHSGRCSAREIEARGHDDDEMRVKQFVRGKSSAVRRPRKHFYYH
jgi:hypothetical protein